MKGGRLPLLALGFVLGLSGAVAGAGPEPPDPDTSGMEPGVAEAIAVARRELLERPGSSRGWGRLGGLFHAHHLWGPASACYEQALNLAVEPTPERFRWSYLLAVAKEAAGDDLEEVARRYERVASLRASYAPLQLRLSRARASLGQLGPATDAAARAVALEPDNPRASRALGELLLASGEPQLAARRLSLAAELDPLDGATWTALARAYSRQGLESRAAEAARQASRLEPGVGFVDPILERHVTALGLSARHRVARAQQQLGRREFAEAVVELERAERPDDPDVCFLLALARVGQRRWAEAETQLLRAIELKDDHVRARLELGRLYERSDRSDQALGQYRRAHELSPRDPQVLIRLASLLDTREDTGALVAVYAELAELAPDDPRVLLGLGTAQAEAGDLEAAAVSFERALALDPDRADLHWTLGLALEALGRTDEAAARFEAVLRLDPAHAGARSRLGP